jgi:hypothetical protein
MNVQFSSFADSGVLSKERLILKALTNLDIGDYAVFRSRVSDGGPTAGWKGAYWFPDVSVSANDLIVLYTKEGVQSTKVLKSGRTAHFFYWGRSEAMWGDQKHGAVVLRISDWQFEVP